MLRSVFSNSKTKVMNELLEVISKGIDLLGQEKISDDLFEAWNKYMISTVQLVDTTYNTNYAMELSTDNPFRPSRYWGSMCPPDLNWQNWPYNNHSLGSRYMSEIGIPGYTSALGASMFNSDNTNKNRSSVRIAIQVLLEIVKKISQE